MNVAFFGSIPLASTCLQYISNQKNLEIIAVVTEPTDPPPWWDPPYVADMAKELGLEVLEMDDVRQLPIDIIFVVGYNKVLKKDIINIPKDGVINIHLAPLPEYRGRNSPAHAIMNGETEYGVTIHYIDEGVDTGPIIADSRFDIAPDMTARELYKRSELEAFELFKATFPSIVNGTVTTSPQGEGKYYFKKGSLPHNEVDLSWSPEYICNFVRAMTFPPFERPYILIDGRKFYLSIK